MANATTSIDSLVQTTGQDVLIFTKSAQAEAADFFDGGGGVDTILISGAAGVSVNLNAASVSDSTGLHNYEVLSFDNTSGTSSVKLDAAQFGSGLLAQPLAVQGSAGTQEIVILAAHDFSARKWTFTNWTAGTDVLMISGTIDADTLVASKLGATLDGNDGNDVLIGGAGADVIRGGAGDDILLGGGGQDTLDGGSGKDTLSYADAGAKVTISLSSSTARFGTATAGTALNFEGIIGSAFDDKLSGDAMANSVSGGGGNDVIAGGGGADILDGGNGTDTLSYAGSLQGISLDLATGEFRFGDAAGDTVTGFEIFIGSGFDDKLWGDSRNNTLTGGDGNDSLVGGAGGDALNGGAGVDEVSYELSSASVRIDLEQHKATGGDATGDTISNVEVISGSAFDDVLTGSDGVNGLSGGAGNDKISGKDGADTLNGGDGIDTIFYSGSNAGVTVDLGANTASGGDAAGDVISRFENLNGSTFGDTLRGDSQVNKVVGGGGNDWVDGGAGNDILSGGSGNDIVVAGEGNDVLSGGSGTDTLYFDQLGWVIVNLAKGTAVTKLGIFTDKFSGFENIHGSQTFDELTGDDKTNVIDGDNGNDEIWGEGGDDIIIGANGKDTIKGGDGDDRITGGIEDDDLWGGNGRDTFVFESMSDSGTKEGMVDLIKDFKPGADRIDLSLIDASEAKAGNQAFVLVNGSEFTAEGQIRASQYGSYTVIEINTSGKSGADMIIALENFTVANLQLSDVIL